MTRYVNIEMGNVRGRIRLLDDTAPETAQIIWDLIPIEDKTVAVRWSGNAWRSDKDFFLDVPSTESRPEQLKAGDVAYYPRLGKICFAYGQARWLGPNGEVRDLNLFGQVDQGLQELIDESERAHVEGSVVYRLTRAE
jgi:hypothetical protein